MSEKFNILPSPPPFTKLIGPSFIILGLGLGSGEIILWPYLVSNFGLGIIWGAVLGITFQFFINMEIERYALVKGESVFVGFAKLSKFLPFWFIVSTFFGFGWPGIIASSAKIVSKILHIERYEILAISFLLIIGLILTLGPVLYKTVERFQKFIILIGVPTLLIITASLASLNDYKQLALGVFGVGEGYFFLPEKISLLAFLGAFAFSGAGGNLNLSQSFYIKEKGYGMGKYSGKINSLLTGKVQEVEIEGSTFEVNENSHKIFKKWWKIMNIEHFFIFLITGLFSILLLALLSYSTTYGSQNNATGIDFIFNESSAISATIQPFAGLVFLILTGTMLFATQFAVLDSTSRIISENIVLSGKKYFSTKSLPKIYYLTLWSQIIFGIFVFVFGFKDPRTLITLSAVINAVTMFVHIGLTYWLNSHLNIRLRPSLSKKILLVVIFVFFGLFSVYTIVSNLK